MDMTNWKREIPEDFGDDSRVWIFQASRPFLEKERKEINEQLWQFYEQWTAHGATVKGWAKLLFDQFAVFMADESIAPVSGCSMDSMTRMVKSLERQYRVLLFDRLTLTFLLKGKTQMLPLNQIPYALEKGYLKEDDLFFNNMAQNRHELLNQWLIPLNQSWLASRLGLNTKNRASSATL